MRIALLLSACLLCLNAQAAPVDVASLDRGAWPEKLSSPALFDVASRAEILMFARSLLAKLTAGDDVQERVRLIDGWTWRQWRAELARAPGLKPATAKMSEAELMAALGHPGQAVEGRFFPDTYLYSRGVSDLTVLKRAARSSPVVVTSAELKA